VLAPSLFGPSLLFPFLKQIIDQILDVFRRPVWLDLVSQVSLNLTPLSVYTVGKELGHGEDALVKRVYGHLGTVRHRAEVIEYRVEQHQARIVEGLRLLKIA